VYCQPAAVRLDVGSVTTHSLLVGNISGCDFFSQMCTEKEFVYNEDDDLTLVRAAAVIPKLH
jgi:hypothetical protein